MTQPQLWPESGPVPTPRRRRRRIWPWLAAVLVALMLTAVLLGLL